MVVPALVPVLVVSSKVLDPHHSVTTSSGALGKVVRRYCGAGWSWALKDRIFTFLFLLM